MRRLDTLQKGRTSGRGSCVSRVRYHWQSAAAGAAERCVRSRRRPTSCSDMPAGAVWPCSGFTGVSHAMAGTAHFSGTAVAAAAGSAIQRSAEEPCWRPCDTCTRLRRPKLLRLCSRTHQAGVLVTSMRRSPATVWEQQPEQHAADVDACISVVARIHSVQNRPVTHTAVDGHNYA